MLRSALLAAAMTSLAAPAFAGTSFTAKIEVPNQETSMYIAEKALWKCQGDTCIAELERRSASVKTCKRVAKEMGRLAAFASETRELTAKEIEKCNMAADK